MIYLYVKTHNVTGLKYFGKTVQEPFKYKGSGKYWKSHLKVHGNNVTTEIIGCYENEEELKEVALKFSIENNIVESDEWANLREENGEDGQIKGFKHKEETKRSISATTIGRKKVSGGMEGKKHSEETRLKMSAKAIGNQRFKGKKHSKETRLKMVEAAKKRELVKKWNKNGCQPIVV